MNRRVSILRFYLLCLAVIGAAIAWPELGGAVLFGLLLSPLGMMICCCATCADACSVRPSTATIVVSGVANGTCSSCGNFNGTLFASLTTAGDVTGPCIWFSHQFISSCQPNPGGTDVRLELGKGSGAVTARFFYGDTNDHGVFISTDVGIGAPPQHCGDIAATALTYDSDQSAGSECDWSGTVTITL